MALPLGRLTIGAVLVILMAFLYSQADLVYGIYADQVRFVLSVYFFMFLLVMSGFGARMPLLSADLSQLSGFAIGFVLTAIPMLVIVKLPVFGGVIQAQVTPDMLVTAAGFGLLHGFVKAFIEEAVFRDILQSRLGMVISNVLFGLFHFAVLGANIMGMIFLTVLGFGWSLMKERFGLMGSVGSHFAYNLGVMGILPGLVGVV